MTQLANPSRSPTASVSTEAHLPVSPGLFRYLRALVAIGAIGEDNVVNMEPEEYLRTSQSLTELRDIPGSKDLITRYVEFTNSVGAVQKALRALVIVSGRSQQTVCACKKSAMHQQWGGTIQRRLRQATSRHNPTNRCWSKMRHRIG